MIKLIFLVVLSVMFMLCEASAMAGRPNKESAKMTVDLSDGINKDEAIILAKNYLTQKGLEQNVIASKPKVKESRLVDNCWSVYFPPSPGMRGSIPFNFVIDVDKTTGEVKLAGWDK